MSTLIGRRKTFLLTGVARLILLPAIALAMPGVSDTTALALYVVLFSMLGAGYAPLLIFLNERFPTAIRALEPACRGISALPSAASCQRSSRSPRRLPPICR
jgi:hypothetical protein